MKKFFKIFILILFVCISFQIFSQTDENIAYDLLKSVTTIHSASQKVLVSDNEVENAVVCSNSYDLEICSLSKNSEHYSSRAVFKTSSQLKFLKELFAKNYNNTFLSKTNKISVYLYNEISTRAP